MPSSRCLRSYRILIWDLIQKPICSVLSWSLEIKMNNNYRIYLTDFHRRTKEKLMQIPPQAALANSIYWKSKTRQEKLRSEDDECILGMNDKQTDWRIDHIKSMTWNAIKFMPMRLESCLHVIQEWCIPFENLQHKTQKALVIKKL